jgi:hypothetical protein
MHPFLCRRLRSLFRLLIIAPVLIGCGLMPAAGSESRPKIRAITAFVRIDVSAGDKGSHFRRYRPEPVTQ